MASQIVYLVLSLAVVCYGYPSGFDDFGNIGKAFGSAMSEAQTGISGGLSDTNDKLNQAGRETSDALNQAGKDTADAFREAFGGARTRDRPKFTTPKSIFDEDNSRSAYERSSDLDSSFGRSSFGSSGFGSNGFGSNSFGSSNFGRRDPFDSGFGSSFGQNRPGFGSSGFGNSGFGSNGGFGGNNGFGGSRW